MQWDKAPREPAASERAWPALFFISAWLPILGGDVPAWRWAVTLVFTVAAAFYQIRVIREERRYRAWVKWDEAGGPDRLHRGAP